MIEQDRVGEREGGVAYAEVETDAPDCADVALRYTVRSCHPITEVFKDSKVSSQITSIPTLLAFSRQEAQTETRVTAAADLKNQVFLRQWIAREARRGGAGGAGGSLSGGMASFFPR